MPHHDPDGVYFEEAEAPTLADLRRVFPDATEPVPLAVLERRREALHGDPALASEEVEQAILNGTLAKLEEWEPTDWAYDLAEALSDRSLAEWLLVTAYRAGRRNPDDHPWDDPRNDFPQIAGDYLDAQRRIDAIAAL